MRAGGYLIAAILFSAMVGLGFAVGEGLGADVERSMMDAIGLRANSSPGWAIAAARWVTWLGDNERRTVVLIGFAGWLLWERRYKAALLMAVIPPLAGVVSGLMKVSFARVRPDVFPHLTEAGGYAYTSGHATNGAVLYLLAALIIPATRKPYWRALAVAIGASVGASRLVLGVHWPSDVAGGWLLGLSFAILGSTLLKSWEGAR